MGPDAQGFDESRNITKRTRCRKKEHIKGYVFYIDTADDKPILSLMRHTAAGYAETLAQIEEIPESLLMEAIEENKEQEYFMMYPINKAVRDWLFKALGIEGR